MEKIKDFIKNYQERVLFGIIVILVAFISFRAGELREKEQQSSDIKISLNQAQDLSEDQKKAIALGTAVQRKGLTEEVAKNGENSVTTSNEKCLLIGSKNSDKYHTLECHWSDKIKEDNRVCFESVKEAQQKGYQAAGCCGK